MRGEIAGATSDAGGAEMIQQFRRWTKLELLGHFRCITHRLRHLDHRRDNRDNPLRNERWLRALARCETGKWRQRSSLILLQEPKVGMESRIPN